MAEGAKDWTNSVTILAIKPDGTLTPVRINADGRLEAVILGELEGIANNITVEQDDSIRQIQGIEGVTLRTVALDVNGQLIMVPRGNTGNYMAVDLAGNLTTVMKGIEGVNLRTIAVNATGQLVAVIQGIEGVNLRTLSVDVNGQLIMVPRGSTGNYMAVDVAGNLTTVMKGIEGANLRTIAVNAAGQLISVMKGDYEGTLKTVALDSDGRMETVVKGTKDVTRGLRLWYKFDPREGVNIKDATPWGNDGDSVLTGASGAQYIDGVVGQALFWTGGLTYIDVGDAVMFNFITGDFTLEAWLYPYPAAPVYEIFCRGFYNVEGWRLLLLGTNEIVFQSNQAAAHQNIQSTDSIPDNAWTHVVAVRSGSDVRIYINGVDNTSGIPNITNPLTSLRHLRIGVYDNLTGPWYGYMDEPRIYYEALTADEVMIRYNLTKPGGTGALQEIAVNTRGQIEILGRDASAVIHNVLLDDAGRMIGVIRDPTSDNYMKIDDEGFMQALMKGKYGAAFKTIATDEDGVMLATIRNFPYEDTILYQDDCSVALGATGYLQTPVVAADKIWVVTNVFAYAETSFFASIVLSIRRGGDFFHIRLGVDTNGGVSSIVHDQPLYLKTGDRIQVDFDTAVANTDCGIHVNGYILPAYS